MSTLLTDEAPAGEEQTAAPPAPAASRSVAVRAFWYGSVALLLAFLVTAGVWTLTGGRTYVVSTPSMSPKVPVGSLVLIRPEPPGGPHVGQIIAFHPPNEPHKTYTHRVVAVNPDGTYSTKGDLDSTPDAWVLTKKQIIGVATHHFKYVGWLVRALPLLALGAVVLMGVVTFLPRNRRRVAYFIGGTIVVSIPILVLHPLVRGVFAGSGLIGGKIHALVVNTGLLPLKFAMHGSPTHHVASGYPTTMIAPPPHRGVLAITGVVGLSPLGWALLVLICLSPLIVALSVPPEWWFGPVEAVGADATADDDVIEDSADDVSAPDELSELHRFLELRVPAPRDAHHDVVPVEPKEQVEPVVPVEVVEVVKAVEEVEEAAPVEPVDAVPIEPPAPPKPVRRARSTTAVAKPPQPRTTSGTTKPRQPRATADAPKPRQPRATADAPKPRQPRTTSGTTKPRPPRATAGSAKPRAARQPRAPRQVVEQTD